MSTDSFLTVLLCIFLFSSCKTMEKSLTYGNYDDVINIALSKHAQGKLNDESKHLLSRAFEKEMNEQFEKISALKNTQRAENWPEIFSRYNDIDIVQNKIRPIVPIYYENGQEVKLKLYNISAVFEESRKGASEYHYVKGSNLLENASKVDARLAVDEFHKVRLYYSNYKNTDELIQEAYNRGTNFIGVQTISNPALFLPVAFEKDLLPYNLDYLNKEWLQYDFLTSDEANIDYLIRIQFTEAIDGPPVTNQKNWTDNKRVKDGFDYVLDENGNVKKDSLGNDIKVDRYVKIESHVTSFEQIKSVKLSAKIDFVRVADGRLIERIPVSHEVIFNNIYGQANGNLEALSDHSRKLLNSHPLPFPPASTMFLDAREVLRDEILDIIKREYRLVSQVYE